MKLLNSLLLACSVLVASTAIAAAPAMPDAATGTRELEPFIAQYHVFKDGKALGDAVMQVVKNDGRRWRVDLNIRGTEGLVGLAGIAAQQSTVFDIAGSRYRPLAQSTVRKTVFTKKQTVGVYDWRSHQARWTGDVKETRRAPVALQDGDLSGLLINLAVIRDAQPGKSMQYRFVDDGRVRDHRYEVATQLEEVKVGDLDYSAMKVARAQGNNEETVIWVVDGVPTPVRILQREDGQDKYDLRLVEYKGAQ
ncbi:DUF3108 domain-containing protein [Lysobacter solisilvae (ex Woo and Kim 2020)]|uniref:DUF3108 domain-containing protein n=1 Tax=Agrilutibacter terrestris TaxID=2865112 RepID=A0A7H0FYQ2_9GAMM|nr:DUF3108 domain-containing protein [Lysobacter terrestris]QNP41168.1 DUF3108 domain-containing protein [Lysobacter terrestris]